MKSTKEFIVLFIGIVLANAFSLQAMSMSMKMAPVQMKSKELICTLAEPKQEDPKEKRRKVREQEDAFVNNLLTSGADLNEDTGSGRPLERVARLKSIKTLLQNGAEPKLCEKSPLILPFVYYVDREYEERQNSVYSFIIKNDFYYEKRGKELERRAGKAMQCWSRLLAAGTNADQERNGRLPLVGVISVYGKKDFRFQNHRDFFKLLIWRGANPNKTESITEYSAINYSFGLGHFPSHKYLKQERQKYEAICQLLKGHKDGGSPLSMLSKDTLKEIRILIRHGVPFNPPPEKSALQIEPAAHESIDLSEKNEPITSNVKKESEKKEHRAPLNYTRRRYNPTSLFIMGIAASNIGYWLYTKWHNHKKKQNEIYLRLQ